MVKRLYCHRWHSRVTQCQERNCHWDTERFCSRPCFWLAENKFCLHRLYLGSWSHVLALWSNFENMSITLWSAKQYSRFHWINSKHIIGVQSQWLHKIFQKSVHLVRSHKRNNYRGNRKLYYKHYCFLIGTNTF